MLVPIKRLKGLVYKNIDYSICHKQTKQGYQCIYDDLEDLSDAVLDLTMPFDLSVMVIRCCFPNKRK